MLFGDTRLQIIRGSILAPPLFAVEAAVWTYGPRLREKLLVSSQDMRPLLALVLVAWWIAAWGLFDTYTEHLSRATRLRLYWTIFIVITALALLFPTLNRLF